MPAFTTSLMIFFWSLLDHCRSAAKTSFCIVNWNQWTSAKGCNFLVFCFNSLCNDLSFDITFQASRGDLLSLTCTWLGKKVVLATYNLHVFGIFAVLTSLQLFVLNISYQTIHPLRSSYINGQLRLDNKTNIPRVFIDVYDCMQSILIRKFDSIVVSWVLSHYLSHLTWLALTGLIQKIHRNNCGSDKMPGIDSFKICFRLVLSE